MTKKERDKLIKQLTKETDSFYKDLVGNVYTFLSERGVNEDIINDLDSLINDMEVSSLTNISSTVRERIEPAIDKLNTSLYAISEKIQKLDDELCEI